MERKKQKVEKTVVKKNLKSKLPLSVLYQIYLLTLQFTNGLVLDLDNKNYIDFKNPWKALLVLVEQHQSDFGVKLEVLIMIIILLKPKMKEVVKMVVREKKEELNVLLILKMQLE